MTRAAPRVGVIALLAAAAVTNIAYTMLIPFVPLLRERFAMSYLAIGVAFGGFALTKALAQPLGGVLVDRLGSVGVAVSGLLATAGSLAALSFAATGNKVVAWRLVWGLAEGVTMPALYRMVSLLGQQSRLGEGKLMGWFGSAAAAGMAVGPGLIGLFHRTIGFREAFQIAGGATVLSALILAVGSRQSTLMTRQRSERPETSETRFGLTAMPILILVMVFGGVDLVSNLLYSALEPALPLYIEARVGPSIGLTSMLFSAGLGVFVIVSSFAGSWVERHDLLLVAAAALAIAAGGLSLIALAVPLIPAGFLVFMFTQPVIYILARRGIAAAGSERQGKVFGLFGLLSDAGFVAGPAIGTSLLAAFDRAAFLFLSAAALLSASACFAFTRFRRATAETRSPLAPGEMLDRRVSPGPHANTPLAFLHSCATPDGGYVETGEKQPSLEATRFALESLALLMAVPDTASVGFVRRSFRPVGGFARHPDSLLPELGATYYAVRILHLLNATELMSEIRTSTHRWLMSMIFSESNSRITLDIDHLYYALRALYLSGETLPLSVLQYVADFTHACADSQGGFGLTPGRVPDVERTYCCLRMLAELGIVVHNKDTHAKWLAACFSAGQWYSDPSRTDSSLAGMYWGVSAANLLDLPIPWTSIPPIVERYRRHDGGYGNSGYPTLWHTYCALGTLDVVKRRSRQRSP